MIEVPEGSAVSAADLREKHHVPISVLATLLGLLREAALAVPDPGMLARIDEVWPGLLHDADDLDLAAWAACAVVAGRVADLGATVAEEDREASRLPGITIEAGAWLAAAHRESGDIADHAHGVAEAFATATEQVSEALIALFGAVSRIAEAWPAEIMGEDIPDVILRLLQGGFPAPADWMRAHALPRGAEIVEQLRQARQEFQDARELGTLLIKATLLESPVSPPRASTTHNMPAAPAPDLSVPTAPAPTAPVPDMEEPPGARASMLDLPAQADELPAPVPVPSEPPLPEPLRPTAERGRAASASERGAGEQLAEDPSLAGLLSRASEFGSRRRSR
ncbi:hypothetical protein [Lolliginicoccus levis]|uniref:hypothetical protein n=1 Tax=Lolliginicoccus levis TaxID=2919542 RepID=UPI00241CF669|nr:hypothetical protein [Lolliginicoccus levis]